MKEKKKRNERKVKKETTTLQRGRGREGEQQEMDPMVPGNAESARPRGWSDGEEFRDVL